jgi:hypothetical protein
MLQEHYNKVYAAFSNQTHYPDRRAKSIIKDFSDMLEDDLKQPVNADYARKFTSLFLDWINAEGRCANWMITGPANFPVERNRKRLESASNKCDELMRWRGRVFKAINRQPMKSPSEWKNSSLAQLEVAEKRQATMKAANKIIRSNKAIDKLTELQQLELTEQEALSLLVPNCFGNLGYASFEITNNNAKIKRLKQNVIIAERRESAAGTFEPIEFAGGSVDIQNDRVIIKHDEKPSREVISGIKAKGFKWSRNYGCWCRKHTDQALIDAKNLIAIA